MSYNEIKQQTPWQSNIQFDPCGKKNPGILGYDNSESTGLGNEKTRILAGRR